MEALDTITAVLGWCTLLNMGLLLFASIGLITMGGPIKRIHGGMFGLSDDDLSRAYFQYLAHYKIAIFVFNLGPWLALKIVG
ncbi:MAG: DUF6868 family protein [Myxococcota bacterium]